MNIDLTGTVVLVTGSSRGIGKAIARGMGESGATVAIHYRTNEEKANELAVELGGGSAAFGADLEDPLNAEGLFAGVVEKFGKVDVLVNNAGIFDNSPVGGPFKKWHEAWEKTIAVNLTSAGMLCHEAIKHFKETGGGRIINIASRAAFRGEKENHLAYAASKGGIVSLSRSIGRSFGKYNIKSFAIAPGFVHTEMIEDHLDGGGIEEIMGELSLSTLTRPEDVAPVTVFIAAGMMDHATGTTIDINAGSYMH